MTAPTTADGVLLYDGECPLCQRSVAILKKLDWLRRIDYRDARDPANWPASETPLVRDRLLEEMHVVPKGGKGVVAGFRAFRWAAWRLPALALFAPLMHLPLVPWIGQRVYLWVAKNRFSLVPCKDGVCTIPPSKRAG